MTDFSITADQFRVTVDEQSKRISGLEAIVISQGATITNLAAADSNQQTIKVVVTDERVHRIDHLPAVQTVDSAGFDLRAYPVDAALGTPLDSITLEPGQQALVPTGLRVWIDKPGYAGFMFARSGMGVKGLVLGNGTGVIDSDYQGDLKMCLWNRGDKAITVNAGDRVAQLVIMPVMTGYRMEVVESFETETERGTGGFGSTGVK